MKDNPTNEVLQNSTMECRLCGRRPPDTILNVEGALHHNVRYYECLNTRACKKARKKQTKQK